MEFIRTMEDATGKKARLEMYPMQQGDVKVTYADTSALQKSCRYAPSTKLKDGIAQFIHWYKQYYNESYV
jgi:UDP-glucuronate 4-epimerase